MIVPVVRKQRNKQQNKQPRASYCMDKKQDSLVVTDFVVRVWGMDAEGRPFFQSANATKATTDGAVLSDIAHSLKTGEIIGIQHGEHKARFRVVWAGKGGGTRKIEAQVQILQGQQVPWQTVAIAEKPFDPHDKNRRRFPRHKVLFPIEISFNDSRRTHQQTHATDIGGRGCYVETLLPLPVGTNVNVTFSVSADKVRTTGTVRTSDPGVGMGIEFTTLDNIVQERLHLFLEKIDTGFANREAAKQGG
jgi:hypothetical protein